jgi:O-antigen/teichoic acid export membrane protein
MAHHSNTFPKRSNGGVVSNAVWNFGSQVWNQLLYLIVTPILLKALGLNRFGLWALYLSMSALSVIVDFGLPVAMTRFLAAGKENNEKDEVQVFGMAVTGGLFTVTTGAAVALGGWAVAADIVEWWRPDVGDTKTLSRLLEIGCLLFFFIYLSNYLSSILKGMNRYDVTSKVWSFTATTQALLILAAVGSDLGLTGVATAHAAGAGVHCLVLFFVVLKFIWPLRQSKIGLALHLREMIRLIRFGVPVQLSAILSQVERNFGKYYLLHFAGLAYVSLIEIANRVILSIFFLMSKLYEVLLPESAALWTKGDRETLAKLHMKSSKLLSFLTFILYGAVFVGAPPFFELWLSGPKPELVWMLRILLVGSAMSLSNGVTSVFSMGIGKTVFPLCSASIRIGLMLIPAFLFSSIDPVSALCIGSSVGALAGSAFVAVAYHKTVGASAMSYYARGILPAVFAASIPCAVFTLAPGVSGGFFQSVEPFRLRAFLNVAAICSAFMLSYILITWLIGYIKKSDLPNFKRILAGRNDGA